MKKTITTLGIAVLGGVIALTGYKQFIEQPTQVITKVVEAPKSTMVNTNMSNIANAVESIDFTSIAEQSLDAVVHVQNTSIQTSKDPFEQFFYGKNKGYQVGTGSGVIISQDGYIVTNNHVIAKSSELQITLNNKKTYKAELIGTDTNNDIALLKIDANNLPFISFGNSDDVKIGEWVLAVGNPYSLNSTVTAGIVSAKGRDLQGNTNIDSFIQTDAAVNPGNSGGALVNTRGELIGINTAISSRTGSFIGYSFAVPSNIAKKIIEDIMEYGNVQKAMLGVSGNELNSQRSKDLNVDFTSGFYVGTVTKGSGAFDAGIKEGDIIIKLDNVKVSTFADLKGFLSSKGPNEVVNVTVFRDGGTEVIPVVLSKNESARKLTTFGMEMENMNVQDLKARNLTHGVKITDVTNDDLRQLGVKKGYVLLSVNNYEVNNVDELKKIISSQASRSVMRLQMLNTNGVKENIVFR